MEEEKVVETPEIPDNKEIDKLKKALTNANAEAAEYKRKLREKMTEAEQKEAERAESEASIKAELETLRREKTVSNYKAKYLELGYDADLAAATAEALANGETEKVFANQKVFLEAQKKTIEANALNKQPDLTAGKPFTNEDALEVERQKMRHWAGLT